MTFIYFYIFYSFYYICLYILLIYSGAILSLQDGIIELGSH